MLAVNRAYNKSDYLPCIAWGRNARFVKDLVVGEKLEVQGRIQSRKYQKKINENAFETKTAYEISLSSVMIALDENYSDTNNITNSQCLNGMAQTDGIQGKKLENSSEAI